MINEEFIKTWKTYFDELSEGPDEESFKELFVDMLRARQERDAKRFVSRVTLLKVILETCRTPTAKHLHKWSKTVLNHLLENPEMTKEELDQLFESLEKEKKSRKRSKKTPKKAVLGGILPPDFEEVKVTYGALKEHRYEYKTLDLSNENIEVDTHKGRAAVVGLIFAEKEDIRVLVYFVLKLLDSEKGQKLNARWHIFDKEKLKELFDLAYKKLKDSNYKIKVKV